MIQSSGFFKLSALIIISFLTGVIAFIQPSWADSLPSDQDKSEFSQSRHIQSVLGELAQAGEKKGACFEAGSVENCAACCRDLMTACIDGVVPLCHQGDSDRNEFRHCIKNKKGRCKSNFSNCAWMCRRAK
jgi:hypothetical protein